MRNPSRRYVALGGVGAAVLIGLLLWARPSPPIVQPVSFNHKIHPMACEFCHQSVRKGPVAGRPALKTCATCHRALPPRTEDMRILKGFLDRDEEVPWVRIYRVPSHVYFSHRRHVAAGGLECAVCHGKVRTFTKPPPRPIVKVSMDTCIGCHVRKRVSTDCNVCHR